MPASHSKRRARVRADRLAYAGARDEVASGAASTFTLAIDVDSSGDWCLSKKLSKRGGGWVCIWECKREGLGGKWNRTRSPARVATSRCEVVIRVLLKEWLAVALTSKWAASRADLKGEDLEAATRKLESPPLLTPYQ